MLFFELLYEDDVILAVDKRSGIPAHSQKKDLDSVEPLTVEAAVLKSHPSVKILHRLDTGTSGVLLFAKNNNVFEEMRDKFKLRLIKKHYLAWSFEPSPQAHFPLEITLPLAHHPKSAKRMVVVDPDSSRTGRTYFRGKPYPALTRLHSVRSVTLDEQPLTEIEVEIETGVTHQIRAHLKHIGLPLVGDPIYSAKKENSTAGAETPSFRLGLHAHRVEFTLNGFDYCIEAMKPRTLLLPR